MKLHQVVDTSATVASTRSRKKKVAALAELLGRLSGDERAVVSTWLTGELRQGRIGIGPAALRKVLGTPPATRQSLRVLGVDQLFTSIDAVSGRGSLDRKLSYLRELLEAATEPEQRFLMGLLMGELRQGALSGLLLEAVAEAAGVSAIAVRRAHMLSGDVRATVRVAFEEGDEGLAAFQVEVFRPLSPMLADTAEDVGEAVGRFGKATLEHKLDGARVQVHRDGPAVRVWSRKLREVTHAVPEVVEAVRKLPVERCILDGEVLALDADGRPHAFQTTMRRFGRTLDVDEMRRELPLSVSFFDCLLLDDDELIDEPEATRTGRFEALAPELSIERLRTDDPVAAKTFLRRAIEAGHEGVMVKDPGSSYEAGHRGSSWLKLKPAYTLDLVVLAAEWGSGRRKGWLSNLHLGARDENGGFVMLGKTFKGLTDQMLEWQTSALRVRQTSWDGEAMHVRPELVVEVAFDGVQESPRYPGGYALRFARVKSYRPDKEAHQADTMATIRAIHERRLLPTV